MNTNLPAIHLNPKLASRFYSGFPWIYSNEILPSQEIKQLQPGSLVEICYQDRPVAIGYYNYYSLICCRVLTRNPAQLINLDFFITRLRVANLQRERYFSEPYYRLVHAEADNLPGIIIDRFGNTLVLQINTQGMQQLKPVLLAALQQVISPKSIYIINDTAIRTLEKLPLLPPEIIGDPITHLEVRENNCKFIIALEHGQKTGWFFDHRANRQRIASLAAGKTVLDCFCYSGGFSIPTARNGAKLVVGIDSSKAAIQQAQHAAELNGVTSNTTFVCNDVFAELRQRKSNNEQYDVVILDPPAFVKNKKDLSAGLKGYEKLLRYAIPLVSEYGLLLIASCSYHVTEANLNDCLAKALNKQQRYGRIIGKIGADVDHPLHPWLPASSYLKGFLVAFDGLSVF